MSRFLLKAKNLREDTDYGDFVKIAEEDARIQFERATKFCEEARNRLDKLSTGEN